MAINLIKGQRVSLDNSMKLALVGLGWDTNRYDGGQDFDLDASAFLLARPLNTADDPPSAVTNWLTFFPS